MNMRKFFRILKWIGISFASLLVILLITIEARQNRQFDAPYPEIKATRDSAAIARGRHLVFGAAHCASCHGLPGHEGALGDSMDDLPLAGGLAFELPIGKIYARNITPDKSGIGNQTDAEIARALRFGVDSKGNALFDFMPFHNTSDEDLVAIISYLRSRPAFNNEVPSNRLNFIGKAVNAFLLKPVGPSGEVPATIAIDSSAAYGKYLATSVANCRGCHTNRNIMTGAFTGEDFAGGLEMETITDSGTFVITTPNLTPDPSTGRIWNWTEEQFIRRFRAGRLIRQSHMPWESFVRMDDQELKAIFRFLKTAKPVKNEVKPGLTRK